MIDDITVWLPKMRLASPQGKLKFLEIVKKSSRTQDVLKQLKVRTIQVEDDVSKYLIRGEGILEETLTWFLNWSDLDTFLTGYFLGISFGMELVYSEQFVDELLKD